MIPGAPRRFLVALVALALVCSIGGAASAEEARVNGDYAVSSEGHRYRVRFDPASRIHLGYAGVFSASGPASHVARAGATAIDAGISYRNIYRSGLGKEEVVWQLDHRIVSGWVDPFSRTESRPPAFDATLYHISTLRHDELPSIVMPSSPPLSIPFPFDVGFETELGRVSIPERLPTSVAGGSPLPVVRVGVMRAALILDPWRTGKTGRSLEIGVGARYDLDAHAAPTLHTPKVLHRVAPMTAGSLRFRLQSDDGLSVLDVRSDVIPHWTSEGVWKLMASSTLHLSRTLLALNDQPIAAVFDGGYRFTPGSELVLPEHEVRVSLGVAFALNLR